MKPRFLIPSTVLALCALSALATLSAPARSDGPYPSQPVQLAIPFPPGGATDGVGRLIGKTLGEKLGQPIVAPRGLPPAVRTRLEKALADTVATPDVRQRRGIRPGERHLHRGAARLLRIHGPGLRRP